MFTTTTTQQPIRSARTGDAAARLVNATKSYGSDDTRVDALSDIDLELGAGQFTAIMGPSGSGKSTLMHCAAGLEHLSSGHAFIGDINLTTLNDKEITLLRRSKIGFIFQAFNLLPSLNAEENISLPLSLSGHQPNPEVMAQVVNVLGLQSRLHHRPSELSGGQQQRVAVARALVAQPEVVFADEPTGNLDSRAGSEILGFLRNAVDDQDQSIVMVTHDPAAAAWADRVIFFVDGKIYEDVNNPSADEILDVVKGLSGADNV